MRVLLLSAYDAQSHRYWHEGLTKQFSLWQWHRLALPARYFAWRARGNAMWWAAQEREVLEKPYDLLVATSMVDIATLRGLVPALARLPLLLYFHENQFAYPESEAAQAQGHRGIEAKITSIYSAMCAERIVFNSAYNQATFFDGMSALLNKLPDFVPKQIVDQCRSKSCVLPVPLRHATEQGRRVDGRRCDSLIDIVWNHRWEYDKGIEHLLHAILQCDAALPLRFNIVGQRFRQVPEAFDAIHQVLQERKWLGKWGYLKCPDEYYDLLSKSHIALSTALHDFQGIAVLEAVDAGCIPLVPDRLAYPEWFSEPYRYNSLAENPEQEGLVVAKRIGALCAGLLSNVGLGAEKAVPELAMPELTVPKLSWLHWRELESQYCGLMKQVAKSVKV